MVAAEKPRVNTELLKSSLTYSSIFTSPPPLVGAVDTVVSTLSMTSPFTGVEGGSAGVTLMLTGLPLAAASGFTRRKRLETRSRNARKPFLELESPLSLLAFRLAMLLDLLNRNNYFRRRLAAMYYNYYKAKIRP